MYAWLVLIYPSSECLCMLTESMFVCDLCASGICIIQNEISLLGIPDSCYIVKGTTCLISQKKVKSFEKLKHLTMHKKVIMDRFLRG